VTGVIVPSNPTPNGDLHLGHIAGPFLGADVLRRATGDAVLLGTAWQNTHVRLAAQRQGRDHLAVAAENAERIERSFAAAGIGYDVMLRHSDIPDISRVTRTAFGQLRASGDVVVRDGLAHYCPACAQWRFQGHVSGRCPRCGSADAYGIDCEGCGLYHDDASLLDGRCAVCGGRTVLRALRRAYLDLERRRGWFEEWLGACVLGEPVRAYAEKVLASPLPSVAVTLSDVERVYPAFELAPRYAVMMRRLGAAAGRATMLFGYDNAFERVFLFPAVLRGLPGEGAPMPDVLHLTYFYLLDGAKFSTSRGHVVGVAETVAAHGLDTVRLYLAATRPEDGPANFSRDAVAGSAAARAVARLRHWADTGRPLPSSDPRGDEFGPSPRSAGPRGGPAAGGGGFGGAPGGLAAAAAELDRALRPESFSCVRAADAVMRIAEFAGVADPSVLGGVLERASPLIPETAARARQIRHV
jgi:methionyl-tRNA synthetase